MSSNKISMRFGNPLDGLYKTFWKFKAGRPRVRKAYTAPLFINISNAYANTRLGKLSQRISDKASTVNYNFWARVLYLSSLYKVRRQLAMLFSTFGACFIGYVLSGLGTNLYTIGYKQGFLQPEDYSQVVIDGIGKDEKLKYNLQHTQLMIEILMEKQGNTDVLDWLLLAKHYARAGEEEVSFQCYYMAHLVDQRIKANSKLQFETLEAKS